MIVNFSDFLPNMVGQPYFFGEKKMKYKYKHQHPKQITLWLYVVIPTPKASPPKVASGQEVIWKSVNLLNDKMVEMQFPGSLLNEKSNLQFPGWPPTWNPEEPNIEWSLQPGCSTIKLKHSCFLSIEWNVLLEVTHSDHRLDGDGEILLIQRQDVIEGEGNLEWWLGQTGGEEPPPCWRRRNKVKQWLWWQPWWQRARWSWRPCGTPPCWRRWSRARAS